MKQYLRLLITFIFISSLGYAATKVLQGDSWKSADLTKTWTPPATTGTLSTLAGSETLTNKTIASSTFTGTVTVENLDDLGKSITVNKSGNDAASEGAGITVDRTGTKGSIIYAAAATSKWKVGALGSEVEVLTTTGSQTVTNKTILSPAINNIVNGGTITIPTTGGADSFALLAETQTLSNKSISGLANTLTNISLTTAVTGTLPITNGGTGQTTANAALNALLPSQTSNSGKTLTTDGTNTSWAAAPVSTTLTTKGDIQGFSTVNARHAVGVNGQVLVADSSAATGLGWENYNNTNLLLNPGFEHSTVATSWTAGAGVTSAAEATVIHGGKQSIKVTLAAVTGLAFSQDVTPTIQMEGSNFEYSFWAKTALTTAQICARNAAATVGTCTSLQGDSVWHQYVVNYPGPSSGSVGLSLFTTGSSTGDVYLDDAYAGPARNIGTVAQAQFLGSVTITGCGGAWSSTSTSFSDYSVQTGCSYATEGSATAPGTQLPGITFASIPPGKIVLKYIGQIGKTSATSDDVKFRFYDGTNGTSTGLYVNGLANYNEGPYYENSFLYTTAQSNVTFRLQGAASTGASAAIVYLGKIEAYYFPSSSQTAVTMDQAAWYVDATMDGANPSLGVASVSSYTEIIDAGLTLKPQSGSQAVGVMCSTTNAATSPSTSNTTCAAGSESLGINFSIPRAGAYEVCFYGTHFVAVDSAEEVQTGLQLIETPTNAQTLTLEGGSRMESGLAGQTIASGVDGTSIHPITNCSVFNWTSSGTKGVRLMYEQLVTGTPDSSLILADASTSVGQRNMRWTVRPWVQNQPMPLLVGGVSSNTSGMERIERARLSINGGGTCTITSQSGTWISSATRPGIGICSMVTTGAFSTTPACTAITEAGVTAFHNTAPTTSAVTIEQRNSLGSAVDGTFDIICMGPR